MHCKWLYAVALSLFVRSGALYAQDVPQLDGYVTRAGTASDFDVNGMHVTCVSSGTGRHLLQTGDGPPLPTDCRPRMYGEHVLVFGHRDKKADLWIATAVQSPGEAAGTVSGFALVDALLTPDTIRADGRAIHIGASAKVRRIAPLAATDPPHPGEWILYSGTFAKNGVVEAGTADFLVPEFTPAEKNLRTKAEYDPSAVTEDDRQDPASRFFLGENVRRIPAVHDDTLRDRVNGIAERLIPAVQKRLPADDPNKLHFRFQLIESKWTDARTLPSGIILVPEPLARKLNDDELAAVLADNIATALEKQGYRTLPATHAMLATNIVGTTGSFLVPGLGIVTGVGTLVAAHNILKHQEEQSGRCALVFMHDAGFDEKQAPIAWWRLSTSHREYTEANVPYRAAYLFGVLAQSWTAASPLLAPSSTVAPTP